MRERCCLPNRHTAASKASDAHSIVNSISCNRTRPHVESRITAPGLGEGWSPTGLRRLISAGEQEHGEECKYVDGRDSGGNWPTRRGDFLQEAA